MPTMAVKRTAHSGRPRSIPTATGMAPRSSIRGTIEIKKTIRYFQSIGLLYNRNMKISIIIPAYNAEKYIERCLKSVLAALTAARSVSGEILVIDNGSSDKTLTVVRKCRERAPKGVLHVMSCHTPGAAAARNFGTLKAKGEYIWFIDADDYIAEGAIKKLTERADEYGADLVMMGAKRLNRDGDTVYLSAVEAGQPDTKSRFIRYGMGPWQVMIKRKWWEKHGFAFKEGIIHEDMELMSALILYTERFASVDESLYFYCDTPESVLNKTEFNPHIFDIFPALEGLYERFREAGAVKKYQAELEWFFIWNLLIDSSKDFGAWPEGRVGFERSRQMLRNYFPAWRKNRFLSEKPLKLRLRIRFNYYK